ncbi:MAG: hypothetical protein AB1611_03105 [bacterium]
MSLPKSRYLQKEATGSFPGFSFNADGYVVRRDADDQCGVNHARLLSGARVHDCELLFRRCVHARETSHHVCVHENDGIQDEYAREYVFHVSHDATYSFHLLS